MRNMKMMTAAWLLTTSLALFGLGGCITAADDASGDPVQEITDAIGTLIESDEAAVPEDGTYLLDVTLEGGSGKATVLSPCELTVEDGAMTATVIWSSDKYDYMIVDGEQILPLTTEGGSTFEVPVASLDEPLEVIGDTTAMSQPHEIDYVLTFDASSLTPEAAGDAAEEADVDIAASEEDLAAAANAAALIDAIYVQDRTDETDAQIEAAKEAWDALTDVQKELVEGENADPDYFGRDTGDASNDDPRNGDEIGGKELLVVSFGTSFNDSRAEDIKGVEDALAEAFPDWPVRRAFTAQIIINHIQARDGEVIDNMTQALDRAVANGVQTLVVQPTHLMHGAEYDEMSEALSAYEDRIETIVVAEPLLGSVGSDASVINDDKKAVAEAVVAAALEDAGYDNLEDAVADGTAFVFMGHGTAHTAKVSYSQMASQMAALGYANVFVGTVEGEPEETACENIIAEVQEAGFSKVVLRPLMVVAGDHANNDMAGDEEDSWKSMFEAAGFEVETQISGLGRIPEVQDLYVAHTKAAMDEIGSADEVTSEAAEADKTEADATEAGEAEAAEAGAAEAAEAGEAEAAEAAEAGTAEAAEAGTVGAAEAGEAEAAEAGTAEAEGELADGVYTALFNTDSSMFHVNEAYEGKGELTVKEGSMTIHVSLVSKKIVGLYPGLASDAEADEAGMLQPTTDTVTYSDGTTEEVYGFDVPVPAIGEEFDLAILGESGKWYDHKVSVSQPEA